ncbi:MAG: ankyrin repeat domain-containing protein [Armatimonas sp.]
MRCFVPLLCVAALAVPVRAADDLFTAIRSGDANVVQRAIAAGADVNGQDDKGNSPLKVATSTSNEAIVRLLLANGAVDDFAMLLVEAVSARSVPLGKLFLAKTGSVNVKLPDGTTPLHRAAQINDRDTLRWLITTGANLNARREDGITALADAAWNGHEDAILRLLAAGADPNAGTTNERKTPLHQAASQGHDRIVEHLIASGADCGARMLNGWSPFRFALDQNKLYSALLCHDAELVREQTRNRISTTRIDSQSIRPVRYATKGFPVPRAGWSRVFTETATGIPSARWSSVPGADSEPLIFAQTPQGGKPFFGKFGRQTVRLSLKALPPHRAVSVRFTLLIFDSWDGDRYGTGADMWLLDVVNGPRLIETSFFNNTEDPDFSRLPVQSFPGTHMLNSYPGRTASLLNNSLAEPRDWGGDGKLIARDATYDIEVVFPHTASTLTLDFTGAASQETADESWGLETVRVSVAK